MKARMNVGPSFQAKIMISTFKKLDGEIKEKPEMFFTNDQQDFVIRKIRNSIFKTDKTLGEMDENGLRKYNALLELITGRKSTEISGKKFVTTFRDKLMVYTGKASENGSEFVYINFNA